MNKVKQIAAAAVSLAIAAGAFCLGRIMAPWSLPAVVELGRSEHHGWVEVWQAGELSSERHETKDAELWQVIDPLLRDSPDLYQSPSPGEPRRGRGLILQAS